MKINLFILTHDSKPFTTIMMDNLNSQAEIDDYVRCINLNYPFVDVEIREVEL